MLSEEAFITGGICVLVYFVMNLWNKRPIWQAARESVAGAALVLLLLSLLRYFEGA